MNNLAFIQYLKTQIQTLKKNKENLEQLQQSIFTLENNYSLIKQEKVD